MARGITKNTTVGMKNKRSNNPERSRHIQRKYGG